MDVSVVILAYGEEEWLLESVSSALASEGVTVEVVIVDNGASKQAIASVRDLPRVTVLEPGANLGFAGGVNVGVEATRAPVVVLLNSDAHVAPDALRILRDDALAPGAGIVGALILLAEEPDQVNSAGNPLHVLGLSWAGRMGEDASDIVEPTAAASASGACLAMARALWDRLGGFDAAYFAYLEDMEISWRTHQLGLPVMVQPNARAWHHYEFSRTPIKMYLLERNRLLFLLTVHQRRTLALLAPPLLALEVAMLAVAARQGWARQKVRGWWWLATNLRHVARRRRVVQASRTVPDAELTGFLTARFAATQMGLPPGGGALETALGVYWSGVKRWVPSHLPRRP